MVALCAHRPLRRAFCFRPTTGTGSQSVRQRRSAGWTEREMGAGASAGLPERLDRAAVERLAPSPECFDARAFDIRADVDGCVPREAVSEAAGAPLWLF